MKNKDAFEIMIDDQPFTRKEMEEALKESERSKAVLLSNLPGVAYRCRNDENWTMTYISEGCLELTGYTAEELVNNQPITFYQLIDPEDKTIIFKKWLQDVELRTKSNDEYKITTKSGEKKWVWEQSLPVKDNNGEYTYSEGFILDITATKETEESLRESEDRFRTIFEEAPLGIGIFHTQTGFVYQLNRKFGEILGRTTEELVTLDWKSYSHPDELAENISKLNLLKKNKINGFSMNKRFIKPDGTFIWANMVIAPFKAETIKDIHLCMIEDITLSKIKEQEIAYLSYHDSLTGLYNRTFFEEEQKRLDASRSVPLSLIMGDVNGLKLINDSFGHLQGDKLLKEIGQMLQHCCRGEDFISRVGGDEFVIFLSGIDQIGAEKVCERIYKTCREYEKKQERQTFALSISLGFATKNKPNQRIEELLMQAEEMLYGKKNADRKKVRKTIMTVIKKELALNNFQSEKDFNTFLKFSRDVGEGLKLSANKIRELQLLAEMHDIGQLSLSRSLIGRDSGKVSDQKMFEYQKHPETGFRIALGVPELKTLADEIFAHHEHWDGSGYPRGIKGERIPLLARIICVVDACYEFTQGKLNIEGDEKANLVQFLRKNGGKKFDPNVVKVCIEVINRL